MEGTFECAATAATPLVVMTVFHALFSPEIEREEWMMFLRREQKGGDTLM